VFFTFLILTVGISVRPQGLRSFKLSRPPVPEDAANRTARRLAVEKDKEKKDAEKARARERMRARKPWRSAVGGKQGTGSRWSRRRTRLTMTTTTMMMMTKMMTWWPGLASVQT
jgi:hypothetical protein